MSAVIRLDQLLRETMTVPSRNLVTRPTGVAVRTRLLLELREQVGDAQLDFSQVGVVDFSCADEIVVKLLAVIEELPVTRVLLVGVHPHHADAIDQALDRQGMTVVALLEDTRGPRLLGLIPVDCGEVFDALAALGRTTARAIEELLCWPAGRADRALTDLVRRRCALAHPDASFELGVLT